MTEIECRKCAFYFRRNEQLDPGIIVPVEGCVREIEDPDDCHEFEEKWVGEKQYNEKLDGFHSEKMTEKEFETWRKVLDEQRVLRLRRVKKELNDIITNSSEDY